MTKEIHFPHSLGLLYSALTYYTGFKVNSGEYKVMGFAPYGEPTYAKTIFDHLIDLKPDGSFRLNLDYFNYCTGLTMTNERFDALFGGPPRRPEQLLEQRHMNLAASIQAVLEEIVLAPDAFVGAGDWHPQSCDGRRRRAQLRGQRQGAARRKIQEYLDSTGGWRCRRRTRRRTCRLSHLFKGKPRKLNGSLDGMHGSYLGPAFQPSRLRTAPGRCWCSLYGG